MMEYARWEGGVGSRERGKEMGEDLQAYCGNTVDEDEAVGESISEK